MEWWLISRLRPTVNMPKFSKWRPMNRLCYWASIVSAKPMIGCENRADSQQHMLLYVGCIHKRNCATQRHQRQNAAFRNELRLADFSPLQWTTALVVYIDINYMDCWHRSSRNILRRTFKTIVRVRAHWFGPWYNQSFYHSQYRSTCSAFTLVT